MIVNQCSIHARVGARVLLAYADPDLRDWVLADYDYPRLTDRTPRNREELDAVLERIRESGIAHDREELRTGVHSISAPLFVDGRVRAALSLTAPRDRFESHREAYLDALRECADLPARRRDEGEDD